MAADHILKTKEKSKLSKTVLEKKILLNDKEIKKLDGQVVKLQLKIDEWLNNIHPQHMDLQKQIGEHNTVFVKLDHKVKKLRDDIEFYKENDECPTCEQSIDENFKTDIVNTLYLKYDEADAAKVDLNGRIDEMRARNNLYIKIQDESRESEVESAKKTASIKSMHSFTKELTQQIGELGNIDAELVEEKTKLKMYKDELETINRQKERLTEDNNYLVLAKQLLQDSGIKTKIIKRYLPVMNKLINSYLAALEFQVKFDLDEEFKETIRSRYRDVFRYDNFSEGEKMRIDLSLLFTWRQIAKMKNSANTNLLILDEIFDSSLDYNGTDEFLKIVSTLSGENVFIISHKSDLNVDKFDSTIRFEKQNNFSKMIS